VSSGEKPIVILGAGPAGIGAGLALGDRAIVLEGTAHLGGLSRTLELAGAVFDLGGHSFHTPHRSIADLVFGAVDMFEQTREARCYFQGEMIPFPFQKNFRVIRDEAIRAECAAGLLAAGDGRRARHFEEYLTDRFGPGIARHFLLPYNRKLWGQDLSRLDVDWVDQRVTAPTESRLDRRLRPGERAPLEADTRVAYPARGGFGEIFQALARRLPRLSLGQRVAHIDPVWQELTTAGGRRLGWDRLVSTLPITSLLELLDDVPPEIDQAARRLRALPLDIVLVVVDHPVDTPIQRVYCCDPEIPGHKIAINHNSSPYLRSLPRHGIAVEVSRTGQKRWSSPTELARQAVAGLEVLGLIGSASEVVTTRVVSLPAAYPVPTLERAASVRRILGWLENLQIYAVGRFGEWAYINSDEALDRGLRLGRALAEGTSLVPYGDLKHHGELTGATVCVNT
jgi:protoporphyrinogen oxidase